MSKHSEIEKNVVMVIGDKGYVKLKEIETLKSTSTSKLRRKRSRSLAKAVFG